MSLAAEGSRCRRSDKQAPGQGVRSYRGPCGGAAGSVTPLLVDADGSVLIEDSSTPTGL